jgi:serine/threonine protein kinase
MTDYAHPSPTDRSTLPPPVHKYVHSLPADRSTLLPLVNKYAQPPVNKYAQPKKPNSNAKNENKHIKIWPRRLNLVPDKFNSGNSKHSLNGTLRKYQNQTGKILYAKRGKDIKDEIDMLKKLSKTKCADNIVKIEQSLENNKGYYTLYVENAGVNLITYFTKNTVEEAVILHIFNETLRIISCIHKENIYHLDLKLENIVYDKSTKKITIIDFETAQECKTQECIIKKSTQISQSYLLPEFIKNNNINYDKFKIDAKINGFEQDLYSITRMLIILLLICNKLTPTIAYADITKLFYKELNDILENNKSSPYYKLLYKMLHNHDIAISSSKYTNLDEVISDFQSNPHIAELLGIQPDSAANAPPGSAATAAVAAQDGGKRSYKYKRTQKRKHRRKASKRNIKQ